MKHLILIVLAVLLPLGLLAQDMDTLAAGATGDLQKALADLSSARQEIENERLPLARQVTEQEQKLADKKAELARAQRFQENQLVELNALKTEARRQSEEVKYVGALLTEYARAFHSRINFVEEPRYKELFAAVDQAAAAPDLTPAEQFSRRSVLLTTALQRAENALGGELLDGRALDKQGRVQPGKVALIGPVATFASASGDTVGLLQQELNKAEPTVIQVDRKMGESSRELVATGAGGLSLDATLGNAFKLSALKESIFVRLAKGGLLAIKRR